MKVEFNLTFEDFLEWRRPNSSQKPSNAYVISSPGIILALAGFLSLGLGYAILRSSPEKSDFFPGGILFFGGLLATFAAIPVGLLTARPKPDKTRADLLHEFERFYGDRRSLEADETGWAFIYGAAINKRQWTDLTSVREAQRTLILTDLFAWYILPKSAFSIEQLQNFKSLCEKALIPPEKLWSVSMVSTKADYARAFVAHNWRKARGTVLGLYVLGLTSVLFVGFVLADTSFLLAVFAVTLLTLVLSIAPQLYYRRKFDQDYYSHSFQNADILSDAICFRASYGLSVITAWEIKKIAHRWIVDVHETKRSFMLYVAPKLFYIVPKAGFTSDQLERFRELLRSQRRHIPATSQALR